MTRPSPVPVLLLILRALRAYTQLLELPLPAECGVIRPWGGAGLLVRVEVSDAPGPLP